MMQIVGFFAEFERAMLRERTRSGLIVASKEGRLGGRRPKLSPRQQHEVMTLINSGKSTAADAARLFNVHPSTVGRLVSTTAKLLPQSNCAPPINKGATFPQNG